MNLRLRLIVAFFLLSVVPLATVTFYAYTNNAAATRDAAGREAELLAGELTERMKVVTAQLSQQFEQLMNLPASEQQRATATPVPANAPTADPAAGGGPATESVDATAARLNADEARRVAGQLGEVAMLLNNIEVRGFGRGRGGLTRSAPRENDSVPGGSQAAPSLSGAAPQAAPTAPGAANDRLSTDGQGRRQDSADRREGRDPSDNRDDRDDRDRRSADAAEQPDSARIEIDLGPMRREILRQIFPDRERWDQLSQPEREVILAKVNERMVGIQQGIQILQEKASQEAANAQTAATTATETPRRPSPPAPSTGEDPGPGGTGAQPRPQAKSAATPPKPPTPAPARIATQTSAAPVARRRTTALSGHRMDVRVTQNGEVVGQVNADINLPNLLATVFTTTRRDKGEVPFAVDKDGALYTPTEKDRAVIAGLDTPASRPGTPAGTLLLPNWVIVTIADPTGSELKFGIARPLGDALDDLRRSTARNVGLGLGLIGLALIGIVPLSARLTRNLSRLSDGVNQIAKGDYRARVQVESTDEIGTLAGAFNRMAADVERHQRAAVEQERLRGELELGRQIQHDMLPHAPFHLGLTEIRGVSVPASEVGGDFFNYFQTPSGLIALLVGDVSGKGVGAALLMANIQASLRTRLALGQNLAALARELDADIGASTPEAVYATLFVGLLDPETRILEYVNAGHNPQFVLRRQGGLERMESTGLPIGLVVGRGYIERRIALAHGDVLFFYTDGCVEAENNAGDMFGSARLEALLADCPAGPADDMLSRIEGELRRFRAGREPFDDATMMVVNVG